MLFHAFACRRDRVIFGHDSERLCAICASQKPAVNGNEAETSQQINEPHCHAANPFKVILTLTLADWGLPLTLKRLNFKRGI
jgi:hypothetical protein